MVVFSSIFFYFYMMANNVEARHDVLTQVEKYLVEIVQDDDREANAIDVIEQMKVTVKKQHDDYSVIQSDYLKISADYNADVRQYHALDKKFDAFWQSTMKQQVDLRFSLKDQLTKEEWKKLYKEIN
jgi:hypothetical protein